MSRHKKNEGKKLRGWEGRRRIPSYLLLFLFSLLLVAWAKDQPPETGPNVVILRELENTYEAVPFEHQLHAKMAEMWNGCVTCHHRSPQPGAGAPPVGSVPVRASNARVAGFQPAEDAAKMAATQTPSGVTTNGAMTQEASAQVPACKSCHPVAAADVDIHRPSLKGAYHRQCLNCHQEWMHENACVICHKPKQGRPAGQADPPPDDIVGRMHPPIPEPDAKIYRTRFTPADGGNVLFRHREHTVAFGIKCVNCHYRDNCAHCHGPTGDTSTQKPLRPGMTWNESHGPCMGCHKEDRCRHCHYKDDQLPPKAFDHWATSQGLDEEHMKLACGQCHPDLKLKVEPACGDAACHKDQKTDYPSQRPGPIVTRLSPTPTGASAASGTHVE